MNNYINKQLQGHFTAYQRINAQLGYKTVTFYLQIAIVLHAHSLSNIHTVFQSDINNYINKQVQGC